MATDAREMLEQREGWTFCGDPPKGRLIENRLEPGLLQQWSEKSYGSTLNLGIDRNLG